MNELNKIIEKYNRWYQQSIDNCQQNTNESSEDSETLSFKHWQLIHDYANVLNEYVMTHLNELFGMDLLSLDMVPYPVWMKIPEHTRIIVATHFKLNQPKR